MAQARHSSAVIFDDVFEVREKDPGGKKFDCGEAANHQHAAHCPAAPLPFAPCLCLWFEGLARRAYL